MRTHRTSCLRAPFPLVRVTLGTALTISALGLSACKDTLFSSQTKKESSVTPKDKSPGEIDANRKGTKPGDPAPNEGDANKDGTGKGSSGTGSGSGSGTTGGNGTGGANGSGTGTGTTGGTGNPNGEPYPGQTGSGSGGSGTGGSGTFQNGGGTGTGGSGTGGSGTFQNGGGTGTGGTGGTGTGGNGTGGTGGTGTGGTGTGGTGTGTGGTGGTGTGGTGTGSGTGSPNPEPFPGGSTGTGTGGTGGTGTGGTGTGSGTGSPNPEPFPGGSTGTGTGGSGGSGTSSNPVQNPPCTTQPSNPNIVTSTGATVPTSTGYHTQTPIIVVRGDAKDSVCTVYVLVPTVAKGNAGSRLVREGQGLRFAKGGREISGGRYCAETARGLTPGNSAGGFGTASPSPAPGDLAQATPINGACVLRKMSGGAPSTDSTWFIALP